MMLRYDANNDTPINFNTEMELTKDYDDSDPFIDERLFYVTDSIEIFKLDISSRLEVESEVLEIADNKTK
jgi:hypothetical protein